MTANRTGGGLCKIANNITVCADISQIMSQKRRMDTYKDNLNGFVVVLCRKFLFLNNSFISSEYRRHISAESGL